MPEALLRILANENVPRSVVEHLRGRGHDVLWLSEAERGASDEHTLALASGQNRVLLTFDKDFAELAFRRAVAGIPGVALCRLRLLGPASLAQEVARAFAQNVTWHGYFSVVQEGRIRQTKLPG